MAAGPIFYAGDRAEEIMHFYRDFARNLPDELGTLVNLITAPPAPFLPEDWHGKKLIGLVGCCSGDPAEGMKALQPIRDLGDPVADLVGPMPYVQMQSLLDALWPKGTQAYMKAGYFRELDDHAIETMARFHQNATSPSSEIHIQHFGGAIARVGENETACGERQAPFVLNVIASTHEPSGLETHIDWAQQLYAAIEPSLTGGAYINFLSSEGEDRVQAAYGPEKFARLRALKDRYDPTNLFHSTRTSRHREVGSSGQDSRRTAGSFSTLGGDPARLGANVGDVLLPHRYRAPRDRLHLFSEQLVRLLPHFGIGHWTCPCGRRSRPQGLVRPEPIEVVPAFSS